MPRKTHAVWPHGRGLAPRFNEAAARCRGKLPTRRSPSTRGSRFNEAAARCRGKPGSPRRESRRRDGFNEAAARCRGKREDGDMSNVAANLASMRPRPDAAENRIEAKCKELGYTASMRPRPDAAENMPSLVC